MVNEIRFCELCLCVSYFYSYCLLNFLQVMVPFRYQLFLDHLKCLVESGKIPMTRIDDAVKRILRVKFVSGVFENPLSDRSLLEVVGCNVSPSCPSL